MFQSSPQPPRLVARPIDTATERISVFEHATLDGCDLASGDGVVVAITGELLELSDQQAFSLGAELLVAGFGHIGDPALAITALECARVGKRQHPDARTMVR
jgi:capsular polysaccharide biosynthesis protein